LPAPYSRLTEIQSRILITIFESGRDLVNNETILNGAEISRSTWAVEQNHLIEFGLLEKGSARLISRKSVFKTVNYRLTERGKAVALNLLEISRILESTKKTDLSASVNILEEARPEDSEFLTGIMESIEVALEGYGVNFVNDVRNVMETERKIQWREVPGRLDVLEVVLVEFFGAEGAKNVMSMICANVQSRFGLDRRGPDRLQDLVEEAGRSFKTSRKERAIVPESEASISTGRNLSSSSMS
jgi:hypothetical protein